MSSSLSSSCHHNGQRKNPDTCCNVNKKQAQQQQHIFTKDEKSYENVSRQSQTKIMGCCAAAPTSNTNFKSIPQHFNDGDEMIAELLNVFQLQTNFNIGSTKNINNESQQPIQNNTVSPNVNMDDYVQQQHTYAHHQHHDKLNTESNSSSFCCANNNNNNKNLLFISPKLLLNKLRLCHYNKYWLVQNKYAEVISNLNYASLRSYYGNKYTNNLNAQNHNGCCISKSNCCCSSCSYCCCSSFASSNVDVEDDIDHTDFVSNLEVRILGCLFVWDFLFFFLIFFLFFFNHIT